MTAPTFTLVAVAPIGKRKTVAHVNYGPGSRRSGFQEVEIEEYPRGDGDAFREHRLNCGHGLRAASKILGLTAVELSGVEMGSKAFATAEDRVRAMRVLEEHAEAPIEETARQREKAAQEAVPALEAIAGLLDRPRRR